MEYINIKLIFFLQNKLSQFMERKAKLLLKFAFLSINGDSLFCRNKINFMFMYSNRPYLKSFWILYIRINYLYTCYTYELNTKIREVTDIIKIVLFRYISIPIHIIFYFNFIRNSEWQWHNNDFWRNWKMRCMSQILNW